MKRALIALCGVAAMTLSACSSPSDPKPDPTPAALKLPEPGQCLAKEAKDLDNVAPDFSSVVSCEKLHVYEIVDVLKVPKAFLATGSREERLERRTELAKASATGSLAKGFRAYADRACRESVLRATGLDDVRIGDKGALEADVRPVLIGARTLTSVGPADQWAADKPRIVCSFRYTVPVAPAGPQGKVSAIRSSSSVPTYRALLSEDFPAERRACGSYDSDNYMHAVLCTNQHNTEALFSYDAGAAFGAAFAGSVNGEDPTDAQWDKLVTPCTDALETVAGTVIDSDLAGSVYFADDGWTGRQSNHTAYCLVTPYSDDMDLPAGSLIGRADLVKEVPAKKVSSLGDYAQGA